MELSVYNEQGKEVGKVAIDERVLGEKVRKKLLHQAIVQYEANLRQGTHKTKSKAERHGSGKKPWKQKHTGRARAGMKRSPLWRGGGNIFPVRPREYRQYMPVRMRREALKSALLSKLRDNQVIILDQLEYEKPKSKRFATTLKNLRVEGSCLVAPTTPAENVIKSIRNIDRVHILPSRMLNAYEVLKHKHLILTKETAEKLAEVVHA